MFNSSFCYCIVVVVCIVSVLAVVVSFIVVFCVLCFGLNVWLIRVMCYLSVVPYCCTTDTGLTHNCSYIYMYFLNQKSPCYNSHHRNHTHPRNTKEQPLLKHDAWRAQAVCRLGAGWKAKAYASRQVSLASPSRSGLLSNPPIRMLSWLSVQLLNHEDNFPFYRLPSTNVPNPSGHTMVLGSTQPLTEMSISNCSRSNGQMACEALTHTTIPEPTVYRIWEPPRLTTPWSSTASYLITNQFNVGWNSALPCNTE
jgi:hypothetical protein